MNNYFKKHWQNIILVLILISGIFLRFWHLKFTPGWWPDEGVYLSIANNLLHGKTQMFSFTYPFVPHPPLFFIYVALFIKIFGFKLLSIRLAVGVLGTILIFITYLMGKAIKKPFLGLLAASLVAFAPETILFSRLGLPYALLTVFIGLFVYFLFKHIEDNKIKDYYFLVAITGLACITSYNALVLVVFLSIYSIYCIWKNTIRLKNFLIALVIFFIPIILFLIWALVFFKQAFFHDIIYMLSRHGNLEYSFLKYFKTLFDINLFFVFGSVGLFFLPKNIRLWTILFLFITIFLEFSIRHNLEWFSVTYIFILYFGLAFLFLEISKQLMEFINTDFLKNSLIVFLTIIFILLININYFVNIEGKTAKKVWLEININKTQEEAFSTGNNGYDYLDHAVNYINSRVSNNDTVLASPHLSWLIKAQPTDPILAYVYLDKVTTNFPDDMKKTGRFVYDSSYQNAKYLLDDKFMRNWINNQPGIKRNILDNIYCLWPMVFEEGDFRIFQNPNSKLEYAQ